MRRYEILYREAYTATPLSFWVHHNLDSEVWAEASKFDPARPQKIAGKGWPVLSVMFEDLSLYFASAQELHHFMLVISKNPMPTAAELSKARGVESLADQHWLNRLPPSAKNDGVRKALFDYLVEIAPEFVSVA